MIRLTIPELTEERRKELVKVVHGLAEEGRVAVRNIRRDCMHDLRELKQEGEVGEDEERRAEGELQKLTDAEIERDRRAAQGQGRRDPAADAADRPRYVAIIMDGNARWATQQGPRRHRGPPGGDRCAEARRASSRATSGSSS